MNKYDILCNYTTINYLIFKINIFDFIFILFTKIVSKIATLYYIAIQYCIVFLSIFIIFIPQNV